MISKQPMFEIREDDLTGEATLRLLAAPRRHARQLATGKCLCRRPVGAEGPGITVWSVHEGSDVIGIGALKELGDGSAEVKSMRTHPDHLRRGVAALLLDHIAAEARARGLTRLSLETGSGAAFEPALALYRNYGFVSGEAFSDYQPSTFQPIPSSGALCLKLLRHPQRADRGTKSKPVPGPHQVYGFVTTGANAVVKPIHDKASG